MVLGSIRFILQDGTGRGQSQWRGGARGLGREPGPEK